MKKAFLFISVFYFTCSIHAQDLFQKHGLEKGILTLSKGRFEEVFTNKEVVQIGSVLLSTKTNKIVQFLDEDTETAPFKSEHSSRALQIDPLAYKYPWQSPYVFCNNNPIRIIDPTGGFGMDIHRQLVTNAMKIVNTSVSKVDILRGTSLKADGELAGFKMVHLDNMKGYSSIASAYSNAKNNFENNMIKGNFEDAGVDLHTVADFYSHSNYISLYQQYAIDNNLSMDVNDIPTFSEAMNNSELSQFLQDNGLKTGTYKGIIHDAQTNDTNAHRNMNLDSNSSKEGKKPYNDINTMHEAARTVAQRELDELMKTLNNK